MKNRLILLIFILSFSFCKENDSKNINGHWSQISLNSEKLNVNEVEIIGERVKLIDKYLFQTSGKIFNRDGYSELDFSNSDYSYRSRIIISEDDTMKLGEGEVFIRKNEPMEIELEEYKLIGLKTDRLISNESHKTNFFHIYKTRSEALKLRVGYEEISIDEIPSYYKGGHTFSKLFIFIGDEVSLVDLRSVYLQLKIARYNFVDIITKKRGLSDYFIFTDRIEFWWDDLENLRQEGYFSNLTAPPHNFQSKSNYLENDGVELRISTKGDIEKIDQINLKNNTVISINKHMTIFEYLVIKNKIKNHYNEQMNNYTVEIK